MKNSFRKLFAFLAITIVSYNINISAAGIKQTKEEKAAQQIAIKKSVESGRFIVKLDRIYFRRGGIADLRPRANYIILDRGNAIISTAYVGRQFDIRPIMGINMIGKASVSDKQSHSAKGKYVIKMKVNNGTQTLDVTLRICSNGSCDASISGLMIDNSTYSGQLVPVKEEIEAPPPSGISI